MIACAHVTSKQLRVLLHTTGSGKAWLKVDLWCNESSTMGVEQEPDLVIEASALRDRSPGARVPVPRQFKITSV